MKGQPDYGREGIRGRGDGIVLADLAEMRVRRRGAQSQILDWAADGEVVEALPVVAGQTERAVQHIIEVAADAGAANTRSLGRQIQGLADHSRFPEQFAISRRTALPQDRLEPSQHPQTERTIGGNVLMAGGCPRMGKVSSHS